jgi:hypothetical protein
MREATSTGSKAMYHQPTDIIQAAKDTTERRLNIYDGPTAKLKSIFIGCLNAFYKSKCSEAYRVIRQYRGRIAQVNARSSIAARATSQADRRWGVKHPAEAKEASGRVDPAMSAPIR